MKLCLMGTAVVLVSPQYPLQVPPVFGASQKSPAGFWTQDGGAGPEGVSMRSRLGCLGISSQSTAQSNPNTPPQILQPFIGFAARPQASCVTSVSQTPEAIKQAIDVSFELSGC